MASTKLTCTKCGALHSGSMSSTLCPDCYGKANK